MKVKLETKKTSLRLSKDEFQTLCQKNRLQEKIYFPGEKCLKISVELEAVQFFKFEDNQIQFGLPKHLIQIYKPNKAGLSLQFQCDKGRIHTVIFEVDIKKPPLSSL
ncbi:hypothetical protein N8199_00875 [Emcibacteraceae bacterium]|nr:hypothetical protein [Emcibacteraceae bacterium]